MARTVMMASLRRAELTAIGRELFFARGYDATSVEDIIVRAGISKGAFYHHFPSKEALLEALADEMAITSAAEAEKVVSEPGLNAFERLDRFLKHGRRLKVDQAAEIFAFFEAIFREDNLALYHRILRRVSARVMPIVTGIIRQGMEEEVFLPGDPQLTAGIVLNLTHSTHDMVAELIAATDELAFCRATRKFEQLWLAHGVAVDRILGLPEGSTRFIEPGFTEAFFSDWRARQAARQ